MAKSGWIIRRAYVVECGNCGNWSRGYESETRAEDADDMREVDGVAMCRECADAINGGN